MKNTNYLKTLLCLGLSVTLVGCSATRYSRSTGQHLDDKATTARVNAALNKDSIVQTSDIAVSTFRGNVHLTGYVDHPVQKERASQLTRNVNGVQWFKNDILIKEELPAAQQMSQSQIEESSGTNHGQPRQSFSSSARGSSGKNGGWEKGSLHAYDPAAEVSASSGSAFSANSSASSANINSEPAGADSGLVQRINTQLRSDNPGAAQNVRVEAGNDGKITLRGMVSSDQEKRSIENRVKGIQGVTSVDNELQIQE